MLRLVSSTYRDDRESLLASLESVRRENDDLRAENFALRVLVDPRPSRDLLGQLQGAVGSMLILVGALLCATVLSREPAARRAPTSAPPDRASFLANIAIPQQRDEIVTARAEAPAEDAPRLELASAQPGGFGAMSLRAALRPIEPALHRCLGRSAGDFRLRVVLAEAGVPRSAELRPRGRAGVSRDAQRCASDAARALRFDAEPGSELRYTLRVGPSGLRVRRARRL